MADQIVVPFSRMQEAFDRDPVRYHEAIDEAASEAAGGDPTLKAEDIASWNKAMNLLRLEDTGSAVMATAQDDVASRIQTALVETAVTKDRLRALRTFSTPIVGNALQTSTLYEVQFDEDDWWGWLSMAWKLIFRPAKHAWIPPSEAPEKIEDDAILAIFSDWGTGLYGAPHIAHTSQLDRCDVCLHLGDTYYSGSNNEIHNRLISAWPSVSEKTVNRTLNGNHEMYSGGTGYFQALSATPFQQGSSCFAMQNNNWLLLCLDTAYVDFDIDDAQVDWIKRQLASAGKRKVIFFSHHQPFSYLNPGGDKLRAKLGGILESGRIYAWFFGHEHRLVLYAAHTKWGLSARCVGNGGFPEFRDTVSGCGGPTHFVQLPATPDVPASELLDGPNPFIDDAPSDPDKYGPHGFLTLELDGTAAYETYFDPKGTTLYRGRAQL
ncbi:MAG: hypothetical protein G3I10_04505 [Ferrovum sp.]|nr:hypothetical protein [Ferrovum sp.]